jgi:hypothetical protein
VVTESIRERYGRWRLEELLLRHPDLRIVPSGGDVLTLSGDIGFRLQGPRHGPIEDSYAVELRVPPTFPRALPTVRETGGRIPATFHKLEAGLLCLGAPTAIRLNLTLSPTLPAFVDELVVPYLFGYSYFEKHGVMPFGELAHGDKGIVEYLSELFGAATTIGAREFLRLASMKRRDANKQPCPCRSGRRLGKCHNRRVNNLRDRLGRRWFRDEYARILAQEI